MEILLDPLAFVDFIFSIIFKISAGVQGYRNIPLLFGIPRYDWKLFFDWGILDSTKDPILTKKSHSKIQLFQRLRPFPDFCKFIWWGSSSFLIHLSPFVSHPKFSLHYFDSIKRIENNNSVCFSAVDLQLCCGSVYIM